MQATTHGRAWWILTDVLERDQNQKRRRHSIESTKPKASSAGAAGAGHNLNVHESHHWGLKRKPGSLEEAFSTSKTRPYLGRVKALVVLIFQALELLQLLQLLLRLLGSRAFPCCISLPFCTCWHDWIWLGKCCECVKGKMSGKSLDDGDCCPRFDDWQMDERCTLVFC